MLPLISRADYFSRGRLSDITDGYNSGNDNIVLFFAAVFLVVIICVASIYMWNEHKEKVKNFGIFLLVCLCLYVVLAIGHLAYYEYKQHSSTVTKNFYEVDSLEAEPALPQADIDADEWSSYAPAQGVTESQGKGNDFLVAVTNNPSSSIYDLMKYANMTASNTQFLSESQYAQSKWVREHYTPEGLHQAYIKLSRAWEAFLRCEDEDIDNVAVSKYMMNYDMFDTDRPRIEDAENPQLIRDLKVVPLQN